MVFDCIWLKREIRTYCRCTLDRMLVNRNWKRLNVVLLYLHTLLELVKLYGFLGVMSMHDFQKDCPKKYVLSIPFPQIVLPTHYFSVIQGDIAHILCQAITQPDGELVAVLELIRKEDGMPFHEEDEEIACSYLVWGGIALHVCFC